YVVQGRRVAIPRRGGSEGGEVRVADSVDSVVLGYERALCELVEKQEDDRCLGGHHRHRSGRRLGCGQGCQRSLDQEERNEKDRCERTDGQECPWYLPARQAWASTTASTAAT